APGGARSGVYLVQVLEPKRRAIILQSFLCSVGRTVVDDNHFEIIARQSLCLHRGQAFLEDRQPVVSRHDDRESWAPDLWGLRRFCDDTPASFGCTTIGHFHI